MHQNCKNKIIKRIKQIRQLQHNQKCQDVMLVLDDTTWPLLSAVVSQFFSLGVKNVTKANKIKQPYPKFVGIYFISKQSINCVIEDFKKDAPYHSINILINQTITPDLMQMIADQKKVLERLSYFGELFLNTKYVTNNVAIITKQQEMFASSIKGQIPIMPSSMADRVLEGLLSGFEDITKLKIYYSVSPYIQEVVESLSIKFKMELDQLEGEAKVPKKSLNLVVMDRRMDLVSPLVSNFYYLNMISDIFKVDFQHTDIQLREDKKMKLNLNDSIFTDYKNLHISKVNTKIQPDFQDFRTKNKAAEYQQSTTLKGTNIDLKKIIRDLPQYKRMVKSYEDLIQLTLSITEYSKAYRLPEIGDIEQTIVSGIDGHGEQVKDKKAIIDRAFQLCQSIQNPEKVVKIMLLLLMSVECSESKKSKIINKIKSFPQYTGLADFIQTTLFKLMPKPFRLKLSPQKERVFLNMHQSLIQNILIELIDRETSKLVKLNVVGEEQQKSKSKFEAIGKVEVKQWVIVMLGGISLNQIVQLQRLQTRFQGTKVNILTTQTLTTWGYLQKLNKLNQSQKQQEIQL